MPARKHNVEEIVATLRQMERLTDGGMSVSAAAKSLGITDQTYYRWRTRYGSLPEDEAKRLQVLDEENTRLKRVIAEQSQDVSMLQDLTQGEILSAARRREAVEYLMERYQVSERRACRLVGQHRSTQRYGGAEREEHDVTNGTPGSSGEPDNGHRRAHAGGGEPDRGWQGGRHAGNGNGNGSDGGTGNGTVTGTVTGAAGGASDDREARGSPADGGQMAPVHKLPFVDDRVPCLARVRTSLVHDFLWLARDSEMARLLGANALIARLEALGAVPHGLVHRVRGHHEGSTV